MEVSKALDDFIEAMRNLRPQDSRYLTIGLSEDAIDRLEWEIGNISLDRTARISRNPGQIAMLYKNVPIITVNQEIK